MPLQEMVLSGPMAERYEANLAQWMVPAPCANPAMFEMFHLRDKEPEQQIMAWFGEFPGKYLTSAVYLYRMRQDEDLRRVIEYTVDQLARGQAPDGYLGVFPKSKRMVGTIQADMQPPNWPHWDSWNHYHCMLGLLLWHQTTKDETALAVCKRAANYVYGFFIEGGRTLDECGSGETNMAIGHVFALLYQMDPDPRWLEMTQAALDAFETEEGGDYYRAALAGTPFYKMRKPRWESLHCIQMLYELYKIHGDESYRQAFEKIWWDVMLYDRHNTGGFSSGEQAQGNPYDLRAIETCCTIAWMALSVDMLHLTQDSYVADELELSTWNGMIGAQHPSGRYFTYNTPMIGDKKASGHDIVFQAHAGSPELNCCSVNGPRGIGMIGDWGVTVSEENVTVNYYGASRTTLVLADGQRVTLHQETAYPFDGEIKLRVESPSPVQMRLRLRIPFWSEENSLLLRGGEMPRPEARSYYAIRDTFHDGDEIVLRLDMRPHFWQGNYELGGRTSIYVGPILYAYDQRFGEAAIDALPALDFDTLTLAPYEGFQEGVWPSPWQLLQCQVPGGEPLVLCDYASAGTAGTAFTTWLPVAGAPDPIDYQYQTPMWGQR